MFLPFFSTFFTPFTLKSYHLPCKVGRQTEMLVLQAIPVQSLAPLLKCGFELRCWSVNWQGHTDCSADCFWGGKLQWKEGRKIRADGGIVEVEMPHRD